tara:strand:- start:411 stop:578 length:168 start_codon:yes stop_codon:yes gene_type:complete
MNWNEFKEYVDHRITESGFTGEIKIDRIETWAVKGETQVFMVGDSKHEHLKLKIL